MIEAVVPALIVGAISFAGAHLLSDARSKGRVEVAISRIEALEQNQTEVKVLKAQHEALVHLVSKLESDKASKEAVAAIHREFGQFREDLERRFDRLEEILKNRS